MKHMARNIRSSPLETRSARLKLAKRGKPYWVRLARGLSIGYRRIDTAGPWIVRKADGHGTNWIKNFAHADDYEDSDGDQVLTFCEAQALARTIGRDGDGETILTVAKAIERYAADGVASGRNPYNARSARIHLPASILSKPVGLLTRGELRQWRDGLLAGRVPDTVNRITVTLSAALELAASLDPRITNRSAWKIGLKKLEGASAGRARNVVLAAPKIREMCGYAYALSSEFGRLFETKAETGARRSQLARLTVADLQDDRLDPRLMMPSALKGKRTKRIDRRPVPIPPSLAATLRQASLGRPANALLLTKPDGTAWGSCDLRLPFRAIVERAGLNPETTTPYALRHSSITRQLLAGIPVRVVAHVHDTSVQMIEKTYSSSISDHSDILFRRSLLDLSAPVADEKVVSIGR
jgi:integrase